MLTLSSHDQLLRAIARARQIRLTSYILGTHGVVVSALEAAAERGAEVEVTLERAPHGGGSDDKLARLNRRAVRELRRHGVDAHLTKPGDPLLHLKAALADGRAFLDDRNWPDGSDVIVTTNAPREVDAIEEVLAGMADVAPSFALHKGRALALEATTIAHARRGTVVECESETFGPSLLARALETAARKCVCVRLMVTGSAKTIDRNPVERRTLERLKTTGVDVRLTEADEKVAIAGRNAWIGSANATAASPQMLDWGVRTRDAAMVENLRARFEQRWAAARPLA